MNKTFFWNLEGLCILHPSLPSSPRVLPCPIKKSAKHYSLLATWSATCMLCLPKASTLQISSSGLALLPSTCVFYDFFFCKKFHCFTFVSLPIKDCGFLEARTSMAFQSHSPCWSGRLSSSILVRQLIFLGFVLLLITYHNFVLLFLWSWAWSQTKCPMEEELDTQKVSTLFLVVQFLFVWGFVWVCFLACFFNSPPAYHQSWKTKILYSHHGM